MKGMRSGSISTRKLENRSKKIRVYIIDFV